MLRASLASTTAVHSEPPGAVEREESDFETLSRFSFSLSFCPARHALPIVRSHLLTVSARPTALLLPLQPPQRELAPPFSGSQRLRVLGELDHSRLSRSGAVLRLRWVSRSCPFGEKRENLQAHRCRPLPLQRRGRGRSTTHIRRIPHLSLCVIREERLEFGLFEVPGVRG
jgi:hypothetical protein